jgi:hypothetical protein
MLDNPEKTTQLLAALKAALPFEVELTERLVKLLQVQNVAAVGQIRRYVTNVSYAANEGGIMCHIAALEKGGALVVSLTQVRVPRSMPFAAAVAEYQKRRIKRLKRQDRA